MLEERYDFRTAEPRLQARWSELGIYQFDSSRAGPTYTIDTPPPTVSGRIHIGHVYSYTHADLAARYHRMRGEHVFYPFGFDDNGLPTERFTEQSLGIRAQEVGRQAFIEACLELSAKVEDQFEAFWRRLGLSVDWRLKYSTIDERSRRVAQASFLDLYRRDQVYRQVAPTQWCAECGTAVAQADIDDRPGIEATFATIPFRLADGSELHIATTRPELLPACVAVMVHPLDDRYNGLAGSRVMTPVFDLAVPIVLDARVEREKGTGVVMCCTFGDVTDVTWWREHKLPLRIVLTRDGKLNELANAYAGLRIRQARKRVLDDLAAAGLIRSQQAIQHSVGVHERCGSEIEYQVAGQWFVRLLEQKARFLEAGRRIHWHPEHMRARYENWVEGLNWDWNISRQRYYGTPFPLWYCKECGDSIFAADNQLPVDPQSTPPPLGSCPRCGCREFVADTDVMDTWATSSLSPRICATLLAPSGVTADEFDRRYRPMSLRPNAHDIIRTWNFYTIVRSLYQYGQQPWEHVLISGHALDPAGKKLSKSKLTTTDDPTATIERYSADAVRYWTATVRTGGDTLFVEEVIRKGARLVTKLWNAARLVLPHLAGYEPTGVLPGGLLVTDRWLLSSLCETVRRATAAMEGYEFSNARSEAERFFWSDLCDHYLEMVKFRLYGDPLLANGAQREAAKYTLHVALLSVLKLFAPFMPHVTDEIYLASFSDVEGAPSIHVAAWPVADERWASSEALHNGEALLQLAEQVRRWKSEHQLSAGAPLARLVVRCAVDLARYLGESEVDLQSLTRAARIDIVGSSADGLLEITVEQ